MYFLTKITYNTKVRMCVNSPTSAQEALDALSAFRTHRRRWEGHGCSIQSETLSQDTIRELQLLLELNWYTNTLGQPSSIVGPPVKMFGQYGSRVVLDGNRLVLDGSRWF